MAERKKVDRKKKKYEKLIEVYKKNNKALCDMMALYSYCIEEKEIDPAAYIVLEEVIKDLEDKDVNVPLKADSVTALFSRDRNHLYSVLSELEQTDYYDELEGQLHSSYRNMQTHIYYNRIRTTDGRELDGVPVDFLSCLCNYSTDFVSEILCSNMEMPRKLDILYEVILHYVTKGYKSSFEHILDTRGAGYKLSRTPHEVKEQKIKELIAAFKEEMNRNNDKKRALFRTITSSDYYGDSWLSYLQEHKLVDFMTTRETVHVNEEDVEASLCASFDVSKLENFKDFYQLEDYRSLPKNIKCNDAMFILENICMEDLPSFIALSNYQIGLEDIELIAKRVFEFQDEKDEVRIDIIENIKNTIIRKSKNRKEYEAHCKLAYIFEQKADYKANKKAEEERIAKLLTARYDVYLRLYNMNESLQEQVPGKKHLNELVFKKDN